MKMHNVRRLALPFVLLVLLGVLAACGDPSPEPTTYVLVHGAWMGAAGWQPVADELVAGGARVSQVGALALELREHVDGRHRGQGP